MAKAGRPKHFLQPRGDQADDARLPVFAAGQHAGALFRRAQAFVSLAQGLFEHVLFQRLAFAIELVQFGCDHAGLDLVTHQHQPCAERRVADASAGVDPRPEQKAEMIGPRRPVQPGDVGQRAQADAAARAHHLQTLDDKGAVEAGQRRDIGHRRQGDEVEAEEKVGLQPLPPEALAGAGRD